MVGCAGAATPGMQPHHGILAEWLRRLIRNQLGTFPREFESLRCRSIFFFRATNKKLAMEARWRGAFASIAQLAEHLPRKQKVTSSILVGGLANKGRWSRGMILPSGGRGRGFDSRTAPLQRIGAAEAR